MRTMATLLAIASALLAASASARTTIQPPEDAVHLATAEAATPKLSTSSGIRTLLADPKAKEVLVRHAPQVVEFFASGNSDGIAPGDTPLETIARIPQAQDAGLTPANMQMIAEELARL
jgi:hypothetical protein